MSQDNSVYDVVITGGGLAGLSLARQLKLTNEELSVLILEKLQRPLPEAAFKVGESTVEVGTYYYADLLKLGDYLEEHHLGKLGLRFFYPGSDNGFAERPEFGVGDWLPAPTYQLDRGRLENHLREVVIEDGVELREGVSVRDIRLNAYPDAHAVTYSEEDDDSTHEVAGRWVVDATGRRRLLQRKLDLTKESRKRYSAAWFRIEGELNVDDFVPDSNAEWHDRVGPSRFYSTNHLMGEGYWIWLIPLSSGNTSIGIVALEELHAFSGYNTYERAVEWIQEREPVLGKALERLTVLDFRTMRNYSYSSHQVFSKDRWSCIGESGVFVDPYYSVGLNMIAFSNGITQKLIELDRRGELTDDYVAHANRFFLSITESLAYNIQSAYTFYHHPQVMALKTLWDFCVGWCTADPQLYHETYLDMKMSNVVSALTTRVAVTQTRLLELFTEWAKKPAEDFSFSFDYIDYLDDLPTIEDLYIRSLPKDRTVHEVLEDLRFSIDRLEELANIIFFLAVEDTMPEELGRFEDRRWINTSAISLDKDRWEADGLFRPETSPRDFSSMDTEIRSLFTFQRQK